jgi:predicted alpha/beta-hydrolase family hydrolase
MNYSTLPCTITIPEFGIISAEACMPDSPVAIFVFAHGAGAGMNHTFMVELATALADQHIATLRFNFLYMEQGKKRPDSPALAHAAIATAIQYAAIMFPGIPLFAGGKSFGGRMTSQFISENQPELVKGLIFAGFPLHPAKKPSLDRAAHLMKIKLPMLFLQGSKDTLAEWNLITQVCEGLPTATLIKLEGADHSFKMRKQNAVPLLADAIIKWISTID